MSVNLLLSDASIENEDKILSIMSEKDKAFLEKIQKKADEKQMSKEEMLTQKTLLMKKYEKKLNDSSPIPSSPQPVRFKPKIPQGENLVFEEKNSVSKSTSVSTDKSPDLSSKIVEENVPPKVVVEKTTTTSLTQRPLSNNNNNNDSSQSKSSNTKNSPAVTVNKETVSSSRSSASANLGNKDKYRVYMVCREHGKDDQEIEFFCGDCSSGLCRQCRFEHDKKHTILNLSDCKEIISNKIVNLQQEKQAVQYQLDEKRKRLEVVQASTGGLNDELQKKYDASCNRIEELRSQLEALKKQIFQLEAKMSDEQMDNKELRRKLTSKMATSNDEVMNLQNDEGLLENRVHILEGKVKQLKQLSETIVENSRNTADTIMKSGDEIDLIKNDLGIAQQSEKTNQQLSVNNDDEDFRRVALVSPRSATATINNNNQQFNQKKGTDIDPGRCELIFIDPSELPTLASTFDVQNAMAMKITVMDYDGNIVTKNLSKSTFNFSLAKGSVEEVTPDIRVQVKGEEGIILVAFKADKPGTYILNVTMAGQHIQNSPAKITVEDEVVQTNPDGENFELPIICHYASCFNPKTNEFFIKSNAMSPTISCISTKNLKVIKREFDLPVIAWTLACDDDGSIYCGDNKKNFHKFNGDELKLLWSSGYEDKKFALGITCDAKHVYALFHKGPVVKMNKASGNVIYTIDVSKPFVFAFNICFYKDFLVVGDKKEILVFDKDGILEKTFDEIDCWDSPSFLVFKDKLFVCNNKESKWTTLMKVQDSQQ